MIPIAREISHYFRRLWQRRFRLTIGGDESSNVNIVQCLARLSKIQIS